VLHLKLNLKENRAHSEATPRCGNGSTTSTEAVS